MPPLIAAILGVVAGVVGATLLAPKGGFVQVFRGVIGGGTAGDIGTLVRQFGREGIPVTITEDPEFDVSVVMVPGSHEAAARKLLADLQFIDLRPLEEILREK